LKSSWDLGVNESPIVLGVLLELGKSLESYRCKPNFVGLLVKNTTTFVKLVYAFS
jgi:hypothetical protein